jgi:hypothetical protein
MLPANEVSRSISREESVAYRRRLGAYEKLLAGKFCSWGENSRYRVDPSTS